MRLLIGQGKTDDARAELDRTLAAPALPAGVGNLMRYQRLMLARDVGEYAKFAVRRGEFLMYLYDPRTGLSAMPLPLTQTKWDSYIAKVVGWRTELFQKDPPYIDADAAYGMSAFMPLPMMAQVVLTPGLPPNIRRDLGLAVWTRAVLLDDADSARSMADAVAPFFPQHAEDWKAYRQRHRRRGQKVEAALTSCSSCPPRVPIRIAGSATCTSATRSAASGDAGGRRTTPRSATMMTMTSPVCAATARSRYR